MNSLEDDVVKLFRALKNSGQFTIAPAAPPATNKVEAKIENTTTQPPPEESTTSLSTDDDDDEGPCEVEVVRCHPKAVVGEGEIPPTGGGLGSLPQGLDDLMSTYVGQIAALRELQKPCSNE